jgi:hypothetical protein
VRANSLSVKEALLDLKENPVVYLRPFKEDRTALRLQSWITQILWIFTGSVFQWLRLFFDLPHKRRLEELIFDPFQDVGPVWAIGRPNEWNSPRGALRIYVGGDWQDAVARLIKVARLIVMCAGTSPGFRWELRRVFEADPFIPVVLILPPKVLKNTAYASQVETVLRDTIDLDIAKQHLSSQLIYFASRESARFIPCDPSTDSKILRKVNPYLDALLDVVEDMIPGSREAFLADARFKLRERANLIALTISVIVAVFILIFVHRSLVYVFNSDPIPQPSLVHTFGPEKPSYLDPSQ